MTMRKIKGESEKELMSEGSTAIYYPTVCIDSEEFPEAKDWEVGETYLVVMELRFSGKSERMNKGGKTTGHYDFEITGIDTSKGKAKKDKPKRYVKP